MRVYIIRHAYAGQHGDPRWPNDALRPLTDKGRRRFRKLVKRLARGEFAPQLVATSPLVRCRQTAELIAERLEVPVIELDALAPGSDLQSLIEWTNRQDVDSVAWVGHSPDVEHLAAALLGARSHALEFAKGAVAAIEFEAHVARDCGHLCWLAVPRLL